MTPMDMTGERRIAAPRQTVWDALNDPAVLQASIPGCESLERISDTAMKSTVAVKIGPMSARFNGTVTLADINPPNSYTISGEGQGGVAGFAKGGAKVRLEDDGPGTKLSYEVNALVGGKIAQLGARLIDASAKQISDQFFDRFSAMVAPPGADTDASSPAFVRVVGEPGTEAEAPSPTFVRVVGTPGTATEAPSPVFEPARPVPLPASSVGVRDLVPREPMGLPMAFWIGGLVFLLLLLLYAGSIL